MRILAVNVRTEVLTLLHQRGVLFDVKAVTKSQDLEPWLRDDHYQACVIDLDRSGFDITIAGSLRARNIRTPLLGISDNSTGMVWNDRRALFLEKGGDDLLRHPVHGRELVASLNAATRRFNFTLQSEVDYQQGDARLQVNLIKQEIKLNGTNPPLIGKEVNLVILLASTPGRLYTKDQIISKLHRDIRHELTANIVAVTIHRVRRKFSEIHPDAARFIETIRCKGYRLQSQSVQ
jgi:DNA-binding response OmpR family regulator